MKKRFLLLVPLALLLCSLKGDKCITKDGYFRGVKLAGTVRIVSSHADFRVRIVNSFPDLKVKVVTCCAKEPGEWEITESALADFSVQIVNSFPDFDIEFVRAFPGVNRPCPDSTRR